MTRNLEFITSLDEDAYTAFTGILAEISEQVVLEVGAALQTGPADHEAEPR